MHVLFLFGAFLVIALLVILLNPWIPRDWGGDTLCRLGAHGGPWTWVPSGWKCERCGAVLPPSKFEGGDGWA